MINKLPRKLNKEPLLDAVFEMRFSSLAPASSILPGIFFNKLDGEKVISQLPASELPKQIRDTDPNLQFAPIIRILWKDFVLLIGDRNVAVSCKMPYAGWIRFREAILQIVKILGEVGIIQVIKRYSLKYVDLIPYKNIGEQIASVNLSVQLGDHCLEKEIFQFRIEIAQEGYINAIQIISSAVATLPDKKTNKEGLIIDIDTIHNVNNQKFTDFASELQEKLDKIHLVNKVTFFKCITPATLYALEPIYD